MGLGLYGRIPNKNAAITPVIIQSIGQEFAEASGLRNFFVSSVSDNQANLRFHPAAEMIECICEEDHLALSAKTSGVGPGYHQLVVQFMDRLSAKFGGLWTNNEGDVDETSFLRVRDFSRLQKEMQDFLQALARRVLEAGWVSVALNMPIGPLPHHKGVASPLGEWPLTTLRNIAEDDGLASSFAQEFYPWWDEGLTPRVLRNFALVTMWLNLKWLPPSTDGEKLELQAALEALGQARGMDKGIALPGNAEKELLALLRGDEIDLSVPGIGYRRRICRHDLTGGWSAEFEGYFREQVDDGTLGFWHGGKEVWFTSYSLAPVREADLSRVVGDKVQPDLTVEENGIAGYATVQDKCDHFLMSCKFEAPGSMAVLSLVFVAESGRAWAETVFRSIRYARPGH